MGHTPLETIASVLICREREADDTGTAGALFSQSKGEHANETFTTAPSANTPETEVTLPWD